MGEWPVNRTFSAYGITTSCSNTDIEKESSTPKRDSSTPCSLPDGSEMITVTTDHANTGRINSSTSLGTSVFNTSSTLSITPTVQSNLKRKRHIAIDVETERGN